MTTFKEDQNQVAHVQVESVEGEYVSQSDYIGIQIAQLREKANEQIRHVEEIKARMLTDQVRMEHEALVAALQMRRWWQ
ncbi:hypothetical protein [Acinetobacter courvalinii]|uniref:hypothetical protein n=1 Tax=Acinetobacter courvalinii TaxID=280147 RepID=UPI002899F9AD|nr:hypothetical protein [Acinetobacter courvalinii]